MVQAPAWCGRDAGKVFKLTEMDAFRAEKWAWRLMIALKGTSMQLPTDIERLGMVGVAIRSINGFFAADVDENKLFALFEEMLTCVTMVRNPAQSDTATMLGAGQGDIKEPKTLAWLRSEVLELHTGFSLADALSALFRKISEASESSLSNTPTETSPT